jgi:hypothetical protein
MTLWEELSEMQWAFSDEDSRRGDVQKLVKKARDLENSFREECGRCSRIALAVSELASMWDGPEWTSGSAAEDAASAIHSAILQGIPADEVRDFIKNSHDG